MNYQFLLTINTSEIETTFQIAWFPTAALSTFKKQAASLNVKALTEIANNRKRVSQASMEQMSDRIL